LRSNKHYYKQKKKAKLKTESLIIDGQKCTDPAKITDFFNKYFTTIGSTLDKKSPKSNHDPVSYITGDHLNTIFLEPCTTEEVCKIITNLKSCANGWDEIPAAIIQENKEPISICLHHIINLSLTQGVFPAELKIAILIPIYKSGEKMESGNYRPISLLPTFSNIFERIFYYRLSDFLKKQKILFKYQFGFQENHSPEMAIITLMDQIINALEKGN
jgi:hypothetical protein